jgi:hypothetical protein
MEKSDKIFDIIISILSFGVVENLSKFSASIIFLINTSLTLIVIVLYLAGGEFFKSYDALSKLTDIVQFLGQFLVIW